jgi:hypothetical protein
MQGAVIESGGGASASPNVTKTTPPKWRATWTRVGQVASNNRRCTEVLGQDVRKHRRDRQVRTPARVLGGPKLTRPDTSTSCSSTRIVRASRFTRSVRSPASSPKRRPMNAAVRIIGR